MQNTVIIIFIDKNFESINKKIRVKMFTDVFKGLSYWELRWNQICVDRDEKTAHHMVRIKVNSLLWYVYYQ